MPAVVVFSILAGVALLSVKDKATVLPALAIGRETLSRVTNFAVAVTPIGLFAIVASAAGTMSPAEFGRLHVFLLAYVVAALFLAFWVLPALLMLVTPFSYREMALLSQDALITAFVTGNLLVVLPVLTGRAADLFRNRDLLRDGTEAYVDVVVPVSFNFPNLGKLLLLLFVMFAGWYVGSPVSPGQYPKLLLTGLLSFFGSTNVAIPYLLDLLKLPHNLFQLYLISSVVSGRFAALLAAMNLPVFTVVSVALLTGVAAVRRARLLPYLGLTALLVVGMIGGLRLYFGYFVKNTSTRAEVLGRMHLLRDPLPARVHASLPPAPSHTAGKSRLSEIRERGFVRMGYLRNRLPYAFENTRAQLVGFDIEMAHDLARTLGVALEFVPLERERLVAHVNAGDCDILMSGVAITPERAARMALSTPTRRKPRLSSSRVIVARSSRRVRPSCSTRSFAWVS